MVAENIKQPVGMRKTPVFTEKHAAKYLQRGFKALMEKDFNEAGACANLILKYMPNLAQAHFLVGLIAVETKELSTAHKAFLAVINTDKKHAAAWAQLARVLARTGNYNQAEAALKDAVLHGSDDPLVADVIGSVYTLMGDQNTALTWYDKACTNADDPTFAMNRAQCLVFLGKFEQARLALEEIIEKQPRNTQAHFSLSRLDKASDMDHINEMLEQLTKFTKGAPPTAYLQYGLGKEYEDLEMWPEAFAAFEAGAKIRRNQVTFDEKTEVETFKALEENFTKEWLEQSGEGCDDSSPIFIIGQPRTGTTLIERIIVARDDVHSAGELQQFSQAVRRLAGRQVKGLLSSETVKNATKMDIKELGEAYMKTTRSLRSDEPYFVDKLPVNYLYAPLIAAALPNAKIIHVTRDPMDSCFSSYKQFFAEAYYHSYDQAEMARHHLRYRHLMEHYRSVLGDRMIDVAYEDVVENTEGQARRLINYLGLEWQDASLEFHKQKTAVTTASSTQVREKAHSRSVGRWRQYEKELSIMHNIISGN